MIIYAIFRVKYNKYATSIDIFLQNGMENLEQLRFFGNKYGLCLNECII